MGSSRCRSATRLPAVVYRHVLGWARSSLCRGVSCWRFGGCGCLSGRHGLVWLELESCLVLVSVALPRAGHDASGCSGCPCLCVVRCSLVAWAWLVVLFSPCAGCPRLVGLCPFGLSCACSSGYVHVLGGGLLDGGAGAGSLVEASEALSWLGLFGPVYVLLP